MTDYIAPTVRKQRVNRKQGWALRPQGPPLLFTSSNIRLQSLPAGECFIWEATVTLWKSKRGAGRGGEKGNEGVREGRKKENE